MPVLRYLGGGMLDLYLAATSIAVNHPAEGQCYSCVVTPSEPHIKLCARGFLSTETDACGREFVKALIGGVEVLAERVREAEYYNDVVIAVGRPIRITFLVRKDLPSGCLVRVTLEGVEGARRLSYTLNGEAVLLDGKPVASRGGYVDLLEAKPLVHDENLHVMKVEEIWFDLIAHGLKVVEGRLLDEKRRRVKEGDYVMLVCEGSCKRLFARVRYVRRYRSFKEMLLSEGLERVLPGVKSLNEGVSVYRRYYMEEMERRLGVVALGIDVL